MKQSAAGVAVSSEEEGAADRRGETELQSCSRPPASRSRPGLQNLDFSGRRQAAPTTLHHHVRLHDSRGCIVLPEIPRSDIRCPANPEACRTKQGIAVVHGLGHKAVESAQGTRPQLGEPSHHLVEETRLTAVSRPGPAVHGPRRRHDQAGDRAAVAGIPVCRQEHMGA